MDDAATGRQLDGGHTGIGGELVAGGEPPDITGVADQFTGQDGTDPIELGQRRARSLHCCLDPPVGLLQLHVESLHVVEQLVGQVIAGLFHRSDRFKVIQQPQSVRSVEFLGNSAG